MYDGKRTDKVISGRNIYTDGAAEMFLLAKTWQYAERGVVARYRSGVIVERYCQDGSGYRECSAEVENTPPPGLPLRPGRLVLMRVGVENARRKPSTLDPLILPLLRIGRILTRYGAYCRERLAESTLWWCKTRSGLWRSIRISRCSSERILPGFREFDVFYPKHSADFGRGGIPLSGGRKYQDTASAVVKSDPSAGAQDRYIM